MYWILEISHFPICFRVKSPTSISIISFIDSSSVTSDAVEQDAPVTSKNGGFTSNKRWFYQPKIVVLPAIMVSLPAKMAVFTSKTR